MKYKNIQTELSKTFPDVNRYMKVQRRRSKKNLTKGAFGKAPLSTVFTPPAEKPQESLAWDYNAQFPNTTPKEERFRGHDIASENS